MGDSGTGSVTVEDWTRRCAADFDAAGLHFGHGTDNALDEAAWLVLHVLGAPLDGEFDDWDAAVADDAAAQIAALARARIDSGRPMAYLLGEAWFCGLPFSVTDDVLVPRSPLAEMILSGYQPWLPERSRGRALDLCCGSGCIGIATAVHLPGWQVDLSDVSDAALAVARENIQRHGLGERVSAWASDGFDDLPERRWDLIVTNPPYVPNAALNELPREYLAEPSLGLVSGDDGLDLPLRILADAPARLADDGILVCEVGESAERLEAELPDVGFTWIEFEHGGDGVFTMSKNELNDARPRVLARLESRKHVP
ncbi:50S ribosomal protein L3 N(5)-glutamine methyltransferase [Marinihelvus fidelis]|uniref:50S ribosomal protein L3 N(5)-glutamine methyltransferase n=1 Tax=Marinihelvus fidelis TaxID=2613842 RepID=A0A5N0TAI1_9GAMM|nr:50S ribosomal protein L3 N(5)-glutamine methyltransferase [Marinihelvus fidelis]KAA9132073.1 50S ribosomal protein L3 N(5)-glutamine methyltransferase [Marinihelvus fidelis]